MVLDSILIKLDSQGQASSHDFEIFYNYLTLNSEWDYQVCLLSASLYYSWYNISGSYGNNVVKYYNGTIWQTVTFADGTYSLVDLNNALKTEMTTNGDTADNINITPDYNILKVKVTLANSYQLDLQTSVSTFNNIVGFVSGIVTGDGIYAGTLSPNLNNYVETVQIHCSIVKGSYVNSSESTIIYNYNPDVSPGSIIQITNPSPVYLDIRNHNQITSIRIHLTDNLGRAVDIQNEHSSFTLHVKKKNK